MNATSHTCTARYLPGSFSLLIHRMHGFSFIISIEITRSQWHGVKNQGWIQSHPLQMLRLNSSWSKITLCHCKQLSPFALLSRYESLSEPSLTSFKASGICRDKRHCEVFILLKALPIIPPCDDSSSRIMQRTHNGYRWWMVRSLPASLHKHFMFLWMMAILNITGLPLLQIACVREWFIMNYMQVIQQNVLWSLQHGAIDYLVAFSLEWYLRIITQLSH